MHEVGHTREDFVRELERSVRVYRGKVYPVEYGVMMEVLMVMSKLLIVGKLDATVHAVMNDLNRRKSGIPMHPEYKAHNHELRSTLRAIQNQAKGYAEDPELKALGLALHAMHLSLGIAAERTTQHQDGTRLSLVAFLHREVMAVATPVLAIAAVTKKKQAVA